MLHYIRNVSLSAATVLVLALAGGTSSAQAVDYHQDADGSGSLADTVRSEEGTPCGIECTNTVPKRRANEHHASASATRHDWYGLDHSKDDTQPGQY
jgi:hypothetical protein